MKASNFTFYGAENMMFRGMLWEPECEPRAIVQITHGMTEHIGRYETLAEYLTAYGIVVAGFDLRGHGRNPGNPECASLGQDGWKASVEDMYCLELHLKGRYKHLPYFLLGFSLGSFLVREYLKSYSYMLDGAIIIGTGYQPPIILDLMKFIVRTQFKKNGFDGTTDLVKKLSFDTYNQKFAPSRTCSDWLCSDEEQLDEYLADPLCRKNISAGLFWQLLNAMKCTGNKRTYRWWKRDLPILLISGKEDPVGNFGKGVLRVKRDMRKAHLSNVVTHLYPDARHDLLHEESNGSAQQARKLILQWISTITRNDCA